MKVIKRHWLIVGLVVVAIGILAAFKLKGGEKTAYYTTPADHGDIHELVEATGTINAVTTVQVGSQVSGTIAQLFGFQFASKKTTSRKLILHCFTRTYCKHKLTLPTPKRT